MKKVLYVCTGNICRSPMAMFISIAEAQKQELHQIEFTSGAVSDEESGNPVYPPAARVLNKHGYSHSPHAAHKVTANEICRNDLVIAMTQQHRDRLIQLAPQCKDKIFLLTDFDPAASGDIADPWYGPESGYEQTYASIKAAIPGVLAQLRD